MATNPSTRQEDTPTSSREWLLRLILLSVSVLLSLGIAEVVARVFFPIYGGVDNVDLQGRPVKEWFAPGTVYRQISNEYDAITTITSKGHRVPGTEGNPDIVFIGDSFTFGFGLKDEDTFASRYCDALQVSCANLGVPGSGTVRQLRRLEQFLTKYHWKPKQVKWFFFGMSGSFSNGNDFVDNYDFGRRRDAQATGAASPPVSAPTLVGRLIGMQSLLLDNSYLMRQAKYRWGPLLKSLVVDAPGETRMTEALAYTREALAALDETSHRLGFEYAIYLIVPVQDIIRGTADATLATLNSVSPKPVIATAPALVGEPIKYYFAFDGHLNAEGSRRVADLLIAQDHP
jgi:hypothetical protein